MSCTSIRNFKLSCDTRDNLMRSFCCMDGRVVRALVSNSGHAGSGLLQVIEAHHQWCSYNLKKIEWSLHYLILWTFQKKIFLPTWPPILHAGMESGACGTSIPAHVCPSCTSSEHMFSVHPEGRRILSKTAPYIRVLVIKADNSYRVQQKQAKNVTRASLLV